MGLSPLFLTPLGRRPARARNLLCLMIVLLAAVSVPVPGQGQQKPQLRSPQPSAPSAKSQPKASDQIELSAELVVLNVAAVDRANHPITDLTKDDFTVYEDNVRQQVAFFSQEETPTSMGLVIDTSRSMARKLDKVIAAAMKLIRESHPDDEFFVVQFKSEAELLQDFTKNIDEVEDTLEDLVAHGQTALLDAVYLSVKHAQKYGQHRRKSVVLITDGEERDSYYTQGQVIEALRESDVQVYVIGFPQGLDMDQYHIFRRTGKRKMGRRERRARKLLDTLADVTGGRAFYPDSLNELDTIARTIARELRTQYIIGYYPTNAKRDGSWRKVRVEIKPGKDGRRRIARTRSGYYATPESASKSSD